MKKIMIAASVLLILLAFVSCNNDNKSLDGEVATTVAEELKPRDLVEKVLRDGDKDGLDISYDLREVEKGAKPSYTHTLSVTIVFSGYEYSRVLTIESGRLTYTFYGTMAGSRFTSRAYELRTDEAMAVSGTSEGTVDVELSIDAREGASGTSYGVTLTTDEEGKTIAEGTPSVSVTIPDDASMTVGGTETKIPAEESEPEGPTYLPIADAEDLTNAFKNGGYYRLTSDITAYDGAGLTATAEQESCYDIPGSTVVIDLAGHALTSTVRLALTNGADVTFSNGSVNLNVEGFSETQSALRLYSGSSLTLDDVDFSSNIVGLFFVYQNDNTTMRILNGSTVKTTAGAYAIGTNATEPNPSAAVTLEISNSTVSSAESIASADTAILFNVNGVVNISNSAISGKKQALILRGGATGSVHHIINSTLEAKGVASVDNDYLDGNWSTGNGVPLAALVIGNRSASAYKHDVSVELSNVTIKIPTAESPVYHGIYVWQNSDGTTVNVSGSCATPTVVNIDKNGATFDVANTVSPYGFAGSGTPDDPFEIETLDQFASLKDFSEEVDMAWNEDSYYHFEVLNDLDFSNYGAFDYIPYFRGEINFNGHVLSGLSKANISYGIWIDTIIEGGIKNLIYQPNDFMPLAYMASWGGDNGVGHVAKDGAEIFFENIQVGSESDRKIFDGIGNNESLFVLQATGPNTHLTMKDCTNYYSAINSVEYSGVFVGGYANNGARLDFINCDNYGTFYGPKLGYLLGNDNNSGIASITAEGCDNYGALYASQQVGFVCFAHDGNLEGSTAYQVYTDKGTNTEGTLVVLEPVEADVVSEAETISSIEITSSGDFDKFEIVASGYATMHNQNGGYAGTLLMRVSSGKKDKEALSDIGFGKFGFIEKSKVSDSDITTGETFSTAEFEGKTYYVIDLTAGELSQGLTASFDPDGILTSVKYTLYLYKTDGELEKLAGSYSIPLE